MRVCLDSNVLISAFGTRGIASDVLRIALAEHEVVVPAVVLAEVRRNLARKFGLPAELIDTIEEILRKQSVIPKPESTAGFSVRDPSDAWVLASAVAGGAELLVTGDADLLTLKSPPLPIISTREFWERLRAGGV